MRLVHGARVLAATLALATGITLVGPGSTPAEAAVTDGFDPGMIISDALFYDGDAMNASEVQRFLDQRVPVCDDADLTNDITCLRFYRTTTSAKAADAYCSGYQVRDQSAAQIIAGVALSCGVSPKALLVTLQKEQGLVTHRDPGARRFQIAMGYACPDSAPCDAEYYGFFNQVYMAARQFKRYQALPTRYGHVAGRTNAVRFSPTSSCGSSDVYIQNQATAGLYNYTPYQPNAAALAAGWGTGDGCSSYGNRNFYNYYTTWFGPTSGYPVADRFEAAYESYGGGDALGAAITQEIAVSENGGGWYQRFTDGTLYLTRSGVMTRILPGGLVNAYRAQGGPAGEWGWPIADTGRWNGIAVDEFENARIGWVDRRLVVGYPFSDVSANPLSSSYSEHGEAILWMAQTGLSTGWTTSDGTEYRPRGRVTRDAMAAFLYRFSEPDFTAPAQSSFIDVSTGSSFFTEIEWLASTGVATGWSTASGAEYRPLRPITRDAMAAFLYRIAAPEGYTPPSTSPFVDVTPSTPFYTEICWLAETGISTGWSTSRGAEFRPQNRTNRDAMAAFLYRFDQLDG